jgi:hypothetical protein
MKLMTKIIIFSIIAVLFLGIKVSIAQDLSAFEIIDHATIGLTIAPFSKAGQCLVDIDNNGWADIYCLKYNDAGHSQIYMNNEGMFTEISDQTPLAEIEDVDGIRTFTPIWVDFDNDGDKDLSFGTSKNLHLLRNDNNVFTDVAEEMGFVGIGNPGFFSQYFYNVGSWADYDLDGDLDCVVFQQNNENCYLFRNDGEFFTDVATEAGLDSTELSHETFSNPIIFEDIDNDGDPDLQGRYNVLYNYGGVFRDVTDSIGLGDVENATYRQFFDYDNDGDLDYFKVTGLPEEAPTNEIRENQGGLFVDVTDLVGLGLMRDRYRGLSIGDFDNDGDQDIFIQLNIPEAHDLLLVNDEVEPGARAFADVAEFVGITKTGDRKGGGFFDYDKDGFLDLYLPSAGFDHLLYHNLAVNEANWVGLILEGTLSNRDAVGSAVTLYYAKGLQFRYTKCGTDWIQQDNPWVHFGIGYETAIDSIVIRWPLGYKQVLTDVAINQYHNVKEPDYTAVDFNDNSKTKANTFKLKQNYPNPFNPETTIFYQLAKSENVNIKIYNLHGDEIKTLVANKTQLSGNYFVVWNGKDNKNQFVSTGVYIYRLQAGNYVDMKKMTLIK